MSDKTAGKGAEKLEKLLDRITSESLKQRDALNTVVYKVAKELKVDPLFVELKDPKDITPEIDGYVIKEVIKVLDRLFEYHNKSLSQD